MLLARFSSNSNRVIFRREMWQVVIEKDKASSPYMPH